MSVIGLTVCLTCNGSGRVEAGYTTRTCQRCKGTGEHVYQQKKPKEDRGRTGPTLKAYCPKCTNSVTTRQHYKATKRTTFTCQCGCIWNMENKHTIQKGSIQNGQT